MSNISRHVPASEQHIMQETQADGEPRFISMGPISDFYRKAIIAGISFGGRAVTAWIFIGVLQPGNMFLSDFLEHDARIWLPVVEKVAALAAPEATGETGGETGEGRGEYVKPLESIFTAVDRMYGHVATNPIKKLHGIEQTLALVRESLKNALIKYGYRVNFDTSNIEGAERVVEYGKYIILLMQTLTSAVGFSTDKRLNIECTITDDNLITEITIMIENGLISGRVSGETADLESIYPDDVINITVTRIIEALCSGKITYEASRERDGTLLRLRVITPSHKYSLFKSDTLKIAETEINNMLDAFTSMVQNATPDGGEASAGNESNTGGTPTLGQPPQSKD